MSTAHNEKEIMDYLDGISENLSDTKVLQEAEALQRLVSNIKTLPLEEVNATTDAKLYQFIHAPETTAAVRAFNPAKKWIPYTIAAASIVFLLLLFQNNPGYEQEYGQLESNPEKLSFIYNLYKADLQSEDLLWLQEILGTEDSPNIRVAIVDLLDTSRPKIDESFISVLSSEVTPTVQMAMLNTIENQNNSEYNNQLTSFLQRPDLEPAVRSKAEHTLSNK